MTALYLVRHAQPVYQGYQETPELAPLSEKGRADSERLADFLIRDCQAYFMLVIKNTDFIRSLYPAGQKTAGGRRLCVGMFDKKYVVSFQDRNDKSAQHLIITNYPLNHEA